MDHANHTLLQAGSQTAISDRMRELLARAAQDHVYEQRTQGAVLDEIRQRLEGMEWLLREVRERELGGLSGTLDAVTEQLEGIATRPPTWAEGLAQHVEAVRDHVDTVGQQVKPVAELPSLWADVGSVGENVETVLARLQTVVESTQGIAERMGELTQCLGRLQGSMEVAAGRFTRLDKSMAELTQRTERIEGSVADLSARLAENTTRLEDTGEKIDAAEARTGGRLDRIEGRVGTVHAGIEGATQHLTDIDGMVTTLGNRIGTVEGRLGTVEGRLAETAADHAGRFDLLDDRMGTVDGRIVEAAVRQDGRFDLLDDHLGEVGTRLAGLTARAELTGEQLESMDDRVEAVNQRVGQLPATLKIGDLLGAQTDGLTRRLGALEETMLALAETLLRPTRNPKD
ncbi:hypothetical protein [Streptosporangium sp. KLBMP 9127]|nr:hypothetical protein [Streptosporangium sp. KLBMP 9127]